MREILFRAKTTDGEWVCGDLVQLSVEGKDLCGIKEHDLLRTPHLCDSKTVGQYIGLTDKNGKKIFEGDIVRWRKERGCGCFIGQVIYGSGCFCCKYGANSPAIDIVMCEAFTGVEVISNIHDNPELLEGTT